MGFQDYQRIGIGVPAAPAAGATVTLFDSTVSFLGGLRMHGIGRVEIDFAGLDQPSAASGLIGYKLAPDGTTWKKCAFTVVGASTSLPATVAADTGTDSSSYDIFVGTADHVKFTFTASGTGPTDKTCWPPKVVATAGNVHSGT